MSTHDNAPPPDEWQPEPRCCPFPACGVCGDTVTIPASITLGDN